MPASPRLCALVLAAACCSVPLVAQHAPAVLTVAQRFEQGRDAALVAMRAKAEELKIGGVALMCFFEGEKVQSWSSKMIVVGRVKDEPSASSKGSNLLAVAYAKAAEMADTLKNSGSQVRPPMTGEFGWEGGIITPVKGGYLIAAFSGGQSADDVAVSRAGIAAMLQLAPEMKGAP